MAMGTLTASIEAKLVFQEARRNKPANRTLPSHGLIVIASSEVFA
jgi:hypothetical protein